MNQETNTQTAQEQFDELGGMDEASPLERLRFFCSIAMRGQDWLDVEQHFNAVSAEIARLKKLAGIYPSYYQTIAELEKETDRLEALVAMQAEAMKETTAASGITIYPLLNDALSTSAETVAEWRAKETEKIRIMEYEAGYSRCMEDNFVGAENAVQIYANGKADGIKETEPLRREVSMLRQAAEVADIQLRHCNYAHDEGARKTLRAAINYTQTTAEAYEREVKAKTLEEAAVFFEVSDLFTHQNLLHMAAELRAKGE